MDVPRGASVTTILTFPVAQASPQSHPDRSTKGRSSSTTSCSILPLIDKWHLLLDLSLNVLWAGSLMRCAFYGTSRPLLFERLGIIFASGCCIVNPPKPLSTVRYRLATRRIRRKRILVRNNVPLDVFGADLTRVDQKSASHPNNRYGTQCTSIIH